MHIENIIKIWVYLSGFIPLFGIPFLVLLGLFLLHNYLVKKKITKTEIIFILSYAFTLAGITVLPSTGTVTPEFSDEAILILLSPFPLFLFLLLMVAIMKIRGEILPKWFIFLFCGISLCLNFIETLLSYSNILFEASFISLASFLFTGKGIFLSSRGNYYFRKGGYARAIRDFQSVLNSSKAEIYRISSHAKIGVCYAKMAKYTQAISSCQAALKFKEFSREFASLAHSNLASAYISLGRYDEALEELTNGFELKPPKIVKTLIHSNMAAAYLKKGMYTESEEQLKKGLDLRPSRQTLPYLYSKLAKLYAREGKFEEALEVAEKYTRTKCLKADKSLPYLTLGIVYYLKDEYENAIDKLKEAVVRSPREGFDYLAEIHLYLGLAYQKIGKRNKALKELEKVLAISEEGVVREEAVKEIDLNF